MLLDCPSPPTKDKRKTKTAKPGIPPEELVAKVPQVRQYTSAENSAESCRHDAILSKIMRLKAQELSLYRKLERSIHSASSYMGKEKSLEGIAEEALHFKTGNFKDPAGSKVPVTINPKKLMSRSNVNSTSQNVMLSSFLGNFEHSSGFKFKEQMHTTQTQAQEHDRRLRKPTSVKPPNPPRISHMGSESGAFHSKRSPQYPKSPETVGYSSYFDDCYMITSNNQKIDPYIDPKTVEGNQMSQPFLKLNIFFKKKSKCELSKSFFCSTTSKVQNQPVLKISPKSSFGVTDLNRSAAAGESAQQNHHRPKLTSSGWAKVGSPRKSGPTRQIDLGLSRTVYANSNPPAKNFNTMEGDLPTNQTTPKPELVVSELIPNHTGKKADRKGIISLEYALPTEESREEEAIKYNPNHNSKKPTSLSEGLIQQTASQLPKERAKHAQHLSPSTPSYLHASLVLSPTICQPQSGWVMSRQGSRRKLSEERTRKKSSQSLVSAVPLQARQTLPVAGEAARLSRQLSFDQAHN